MLRSLAGLAVSLSQSRRYTVFPNQVCIKSNSVGFSWIWPFFTSIGHPPNSFQLFATHASLDGKEVTDDVLNEILANIENAPRSSLELGTVYVDKLCRAGSISAAGQILQILHDKKIFLRPYVYNLLLVGASERNEIDLLFQVFKNLFISYKQLSETSYLHFAKAFVKTDDCVQLLRFVKDVSQLTFPSASVLNRIIFAFAKSGQTDKALLIFDHIRREKLSLDLITYNVVLDILGRAGRADDMLHEFESMKEAGIIPDVISYNTLINSLRKVGKSEMCLAYFSQMGKNGIQPDLLTYSALIESTGRTGNIEESLRLFREMKLKGIRPSVYNYRSLINNLKKVGKDELATTFLEEMNSSLTCLAGPKDFKRKSR
ncbi:Pentatricopeptide repeat-containing protein [Quillaja saponaria]|uniref:Pentatricopeptide repeat-containing protein n=1 Tax=Quillaja saponaria TaxID=32244 RepID=A0AAD7VME6_QUISA|nr:Pentatricopeptide repeat-containing protein [Quillaja saponaria]